MNWRRRQKFLNFTAGKWNRRCSSCFGIVWRTLETTRSNVFLSGTPRCFRLAASSWFCPSLNAIATFDVNFDASNRFTIQSNDGRWVGSCAYKQWDEELGSGKHVVTGFKEFWNVYVPMLVSALWWSCDGRKMGWKVSVLVLLFQRYPKGMQCSKMVDHVHKAPTEPCRMRRCQPAEMSVWITRGLTVSL